MESCEEKKYTKYALSYLAKNISFVELTNRDKHEVTRKRIDMINGEKYE